VQAADLAVGRVRERSFQAFLQGGNAAAVSALELDILSFGDRRPLDWPQLPSLRRLVVRCPPLHPSPAGRCAMRAARSVQIHSPTIHCIPPRTGVYGEVWVHVAGDVAIACHHRVILSDI